MTGRDRPLTGTRIGIFGKGGSGKSTVTVLAARALQMKGYQVVVLDADSTNLGMPGALGLERVPDPLIDYFGGLVFSGGRVTCPVDDPTLLSEGVLDLGEIPDRYRAVSPEGIAYLEGGKMGHLGAGAGCDGPIAKIARDLQVRTAEDPQPVMLIDFKAGMEDSIRGVLTGLDWGLLVVDPSITSVRLAAEMKQMAVDIQSGARPATAHLEDPNLVEMAESLFRGARIRGLSVVLNRVGDEQTDTFLREALEEDDIRPSGSIGDHPEIARSWLRGEELRSPEALEEASEVMDTVETEVFTVLQPSTRGG
ncbi:MAG: P-loop NTPase [bacterium]